MSWVDEVDAEWDEPRAALAVASGTAGTSADSVPLTMSMRLALALVFCLASDLTFQTDAVTLVRIDGPDVHYSATFQSTPLLSARAP